MKYVEYAIGNVSNRNKFIELTKLTTLIKQAQNEAKDLYRSYYAYDEDIIKHFEIYKTIRSFKGNYYLDSLKIDVDKGSKKDDTIEESKKKDDILIAKVRLLVDELIDNWNIEIEAIQVWYSGSGFHIVTPDFFHFSPSPYLPSEVKNTMVKYFGAMDTMPLMNTGLFRVGYTLNYKTGLYKTLFTVDELREMSIEEIKADSKTGKRKIEQKFLFETRANHYNLIIKDTVERSKEKTKVDSTRIITCVQKLWELGASEGNRHEALLLMVGTWRSRGLNLEQCRVLAKEWNTGMQKLSDYELNKQVDYLYEKGYNAGCDHHMRKKYCDSKCMYYANKNLVIKVEDSYSLVKGLMDYCRSDYKDKSFDLKQFLNLDTSFRMYRGDLGVIVGMSGIGKSALAQNLAIAMNNLRIIYFNFEFQTTLFARRLAQIKCNLSKNEAEDYFAKCSDKEGHAVAESLKHIQVLEFPPSIDKIPELIEDYKPDIIIVDTFDEIVSRRYSDETAKSQEIAMTLKQIAKKTNTLILTVNHVPKSACYDERGNLKKLNLNSIKGSIAIVQKSDYVIAFEGDPKVKTQIADRVVTSLKARDETGFEKTVKMDFNSFKLRKE